MSRRIECSACGFAPDDEPYGNPTLFFEYDERSNTYHCPDCEALSDDSDYIAEMRLKGRDYDAWASL